MNALLAWLADATGATASVPTWLWVAWGVSLVLTAMALFTTLFNVLTWPRTAAHDPRAHRLSVLIPARNEAERIGPTLDALKSALSNDARVAEVVVCDDASEDDTRGQVDIRKEGWPQLRLIEGRPLERGWVGKVNACAHLAHSSHEDWLLFIDADTHIKQHGLDLLLAWQGKYDADIVTAVPQQVARSAAEQLMMPLLHLVYVSWLPMPLVWWSRDSRFLAANGQVMLVRRSALEAIGGFEAIRSDVVDDMALCRKVKDGGGRVVFADGHHVAATRMYTSWAEVWEGFSKNLYPGIGGRPLALGFTLALLLFSFVVPLALALLGPAMGWFMAIPLVLTMVQRLVLAVRHTHRGWSVVLQPFAVLLLCAIAINSARWVWSGGVRWSGRTYAAGSGK